ncbi:unnamed protein product [Prorocentrum cordatum]|uniref:Uncharacterized protein n=1 Tax=Prorocentrum cordatum TaxID=2364126 RepID=A0ABN9TK45_9DINO|nr:unnamed protein product [Polarella glacialis]
MLVDIGVAADVGHDMVEGSGTLTMITTPPCDCNGGSDDNDDAGDPGQRMPAGRAEATLLLAVHAAILLVQLIAHGRFTAEIAPADASGRRAEWLERFAAGIASRFDARSVIHACGVWRRWTRWVAQQSPPLTGSADAPSAFDLAVWLEDVAGRGPSAAVGVWVGLKWLSRNFGLAHLPLESPLLERFSRPALGSSVRPMAQELEPRVWRHLLGLAQSTAGAIALFAELGVYVFVSSLRFRHGQRSSPMSDFVRIRDAAAEYCRVRDLPFWRRRRKLLHQLATAFRPLDAFALKQRHVSVPEAPGVFLVCAAALICLMGQPDRILQLCFVRPFELAAAVPVFGVLWPCETRSSGQNALAHIGETLGVPAAATHAWNLERGMRPGALTRVMYDLTVEEIRAGLAEPAVSRAELDKRFGVGVTAPCLVAPSGKARNGDIGRRSVRTARADRSGTMEVTEIGGTLPPWRLLYIAGGHYVNDSFAPEASVVVFTDASAEGGPLRAFAEALRISDGRWRQFRAPTVIGWATGAPGCQLGSTLIGTLRKRHEGQGRCWAGTRGKSVPRTLGLSLLSSTSRAASGADLPILGADRVAAVSSARLRPTLAWSQVTGHARAPEGEPMKGAVSDSRSYLNVSGSEVWSPRAPGPLPFMGPPALEGAEAEAAVPGLRLWRDYCTPLEEAELVAELDRLGPPWAREQFGVPTLYWSKHFGVLGSLRPRLVRAPDPALGEAELPATGPLATMSRRLRDTSRPWGRTGLSGASCPTRRT